MNSTLSYPSLKSMLAFPFKDPRWQPKLLIASGLMLASFVIPFVPVFFFYGYLHRISRAVLAGEHQPALPDWNDWERLLKDGLRLYGAMLLWGSPAMVLTGVAMILMIVPLLAAPLAIYADQSQTGVTLMMLLNLVAFVFIGFGMLLSLALGVVTPVIWGRVVAQERFAAAFEPRQWWPVFRANLGGCIAAYALFTALLVVAMFATEALAFTVVLCLLVPFVYSAVLAYAMLVQSVLFARVYQDGLDKLTGQPGL